MSHGVAIYEIALQNGHLRLTLHLAVPNTSVNFQNIPFFFSTIFWHFRAVLDDSETDLEILQLLLQLHLWLFPHEHVKHEYWLNQSPHFSGECGTLT